MGRLVYPECGACIRGEENVTARHRSCGSVRGTKGVLDSPLSKLIRAAFLAPDLVEAVLEGRAPSQLTLAELTKELPWDWNEQRRRFAAVRGVNRTPRDPDPPGV